MRKAKLKRDHSTVRAKPHIAFKISVVIMSLSPSPLSNASAGCNLSKKKKKPVIRRNNSYLIDASYKEKEI